MIQGLAVRAIHPFGEIWYRAWGLAGLHQGGLTDYIEY